MLKWLWHTVGLAPAIQQTQQKNSNAAMETSPESDDDMGIVPVSGEQIYEEKIVSSDMDTEFFDCKTTLDEEEKPMAAGIVPRAIDLSSIKNTRPITQSTAAVDDNMPTVPSGKTLCYITTISVESDANPESPMKFLIGKHGSHTVKVQLSEGFHPVPHQGDRLSLRYGSAAGPAGGVIVPDALAYVRTRSDVLVRVTDQYEGLNGNKFVFFEKSICCDVGAMPAGGSHDVGSLYKVCLVESKQPQHRVWRAYALEYMDSVVHRDFFKDESKIAVSPMVDFGSITFGATATNIISIRNVDMHNRRTLLRISVTGLPVKLIGPVQISDPHLPDEAPFNFQPSLHYFPFKDLMPLRLSSFEERQITVRVVGMTAGKLDFGVHFHFHGRLTRSCRLTATLLQPDGTDCLEVTQEDAVMPFSHRTLGRDLCRGEAKNRLRDLVESQRLMGVVRSPKLAFPEDSRPGGWTERYREQFHIPDLLMDLLNHGDIARDILTEKYPLLLQPLTLENYSEKFHLLLYLEEHFELVAVRSHDLVSDEFTPVDRDQSTYRLKMANLQEQRPSLIRGDLVKVRSVIEKDGVRYEARIVKVGLDSIDLCFDDKFTKHYYQPNMSLDFAFMPNRNSYRRIHNVLDLAKRSLSGRLFFPDMKNRDRCIKRVAAAMSSSENLDLVNKVLNERQQQAVRMVVLGRCQPMAHVIFGPPGTGKTMTLVEIILQICLRNPKSRLLICAPSNNAIDLIGQKVMESGLIPAGAVRRILCVQRSHDKVPRGLAECVQTGCADRLAKELRVILTTCLSASYLVEEMHDFTHVIVDEAGFATEPEIMIPLAAVAGRPDVQVVLAGDPQQLGPVVFSGFAKDLGLQKSLLSRLLELPAYGAWTDGNGNVVSYCPFLVSKLDLNYRSVESLLKIPSQLFYDCELKFTISDDTNPHTPRLGIPALTFWPVKSLEHRESRSPSIANPGQVNVICQLMLNLLTVGIKPDDIGIITPYRLQAEFIRKSLIADGLPVPKIGTVEEFQGQEKDAIIFSTVRARRSVHQQPVMKDVLGFVSCPKRTNVALTRARFVMMIVGDPHVLVLDKYWKSILRYCLAKDLYQTDLHNKRDYPPPVLSDTHRCAQEDAEIEEEQLVPDEKDMDISAGDAESEDEE